MNFWALKDILLQEAQSYTEFKSFCKKEQSSTFEIPWYNLVSSAKLTILEYWNYPMKNMYQPVQVMSDLIKYALPDEKYVSTSAGYV